MLGVVGVVLPWRYPTKKKSIQTEIPTMEKIIIPEKAGQYLISQMLAKLASNDPCSFNPKNPHFLFPQLS